MVAYLDCHYSRASEPGVYRRQSLAAAEKLAGQSRTTKAIVEKESVRWLNHYDRACEVQAQCPDTLVISIADREEIFTNGFSVLNRSMKIVESVTSYERKPIENLS